MLQYNSRSVGASESFSGDFIIYQPRGKHTGRTKVKQGTHTQRLPSSARVSHILTSLAWPPSAQLVYEFKSSTLQHMHLDQYRHLVLLVTATVTRINGAALDRVSTRRDHSSAADSQQRQQELERNPQRKNPMQIPKADRGDPLHITLTSNYFEVSVMCSVTLAFGANRGRRALS